VLIKEWASTGDAIQIDTWLAERAKANPRYWLRERLRFRSEQGTADELVIELANQVRQQPKNVEVALRFLQATEVVRDSAGDIGWLGEICRPPPAYSSLRLGRALRAAPRASIALLEHSLEMPFTAEDAATLRAELSHTMARGAPPPLEQLVRHLTKRELLTALHAAGDSARAQKLLEELADTQPDSLPPSGFDALAGQVQAASGARVVQQRFQEAEPENEHSAAYWQRRALYYAGRKEHAEAIAAYEKALQRSTLDTDEHPARSSGIELRSSVLRSYVSFLEQSDRKESAVQLLDRELRRAPLDGIYAQRIVNILMHGGSSALSAIDRERLWEYLAARRQWSREEELLLWRLVEHPAEQRLTAWSRAEGLARDGDPSRSLVLGWVMSRSHASARAIPWLKSAWERLEQVDERHKAAFTLFETYLNVGDWRSAETIWPVARQRLTPGEMPDWLGRIALAAARDWEHTDALRLWKQRANLDRASTIHLDEMLRAGLRNQLTEFYRALAERDPDCQSITRVVQHIESL
jgi:tetratricopeptide (TPR) repeat protein